MTSNSATTQTPLNPNNAFRVLHTADWHLGKLLGEHPREEEHRRFLTFLLQVIREHGVDLLVIAGDVFDSANPPQSAEAQYYDFLSALFQQGGCSAVIVAGNHDSPAHLEAPRKVLKALRAHVIGTLPSSPTAALLPFPDADSPRLVLAAVPFLRDRDLRTGQSGQSADEVQRDLVAGIKRRYQEVAAAAKPWTDRHIPLLVTGHLTVFGCTLSESEREIHVGGLGAVGADSFPQDFAYVALGHLHRPQAPSGNPTVRYAGSPIPLSFSEATDHKEVRLLDFAEGRLVNQASLEIPLARSLAQVRSTRQSLEPDLATYQPPATPLPPWVEVVVEDPLAGENLYDRVQDLARGKPFEVIRVVGKRSASIQMPEGHPDNINDILAEPAQVFARRLEVEPSLTKEEREGLSTVFHELLDLHAQQERQPEPSTAGNPN
jgi:DNA repair protein SbcD/Mre11